MTLYETIAVLKSLALSQPNVRQAEDGSIYDIMNANPSCQYGSVVITQNTHRTDENFDRYGLTIFYIDRLVDDLEDNRLQIQSIAKEVLNNIVRAFCNDYDVDFQELSFTPFTERFADLCAGMYCSVVFEIPVDTVCAEVYAPYLPERERKEERGEFLYERDYRELDYGYAYNYFAALPSVSVGGCSCLRSGNYIGRNLDWLDDWEVNAVVRTPDTIGVAGGLSSLTVTQMESGMTEEQDKILPFYLQDGLNTSGLFAEMNVVPFNGSSRTVVDNPTDSICAIMLVRYIIDHYVDVDEAVADLMTKEIWLPRTLVNMGYGLHFMLADEDETVVLEIVDDELKIVDSQISTNFDIYGVTFNEDGSVYTPADAPTHTATSQGIADYATGLERWNILNSKVVEDKDGMLDAMTYVNFSKAYTEGWASEFVGGDITVDTPADNAAFRDRIRHYKVLWDTHTKDDADCWITCHTSVYDLAEKVLYVRTQENNAVNRYML